MYLLDSSVVIELMCAGKRSETVVNTVGTGEIAISPFTVHEILFGLEKEDPEGAKFLDGITIMNYDRQCAEISAKTDKNMSKAGTRLGVIDIMIASVAIRNKIPLVTFDKAFSRVKDLDAKILP